MRNIITARLAGNILLTVMLLFALLFVMILLGVVPSSFIGGGQPDNSSNPPFPFEIIALFTILVFSYIISIKSGYIKAENLTKTANVGIWLIFVYFVLNAMGNLASDVTLEKLVFAPITAFLALLSLRLAIEK